MDRVLIGSYDIKFKSAFRNLKSAILLAALLFALCFSADAQQPTKIPRIGFLSGSGDPNTPGLQLEAFRRGLHTTNRVTCGFSRSYSHAAAVPSSNVTCKSPRKPWINCRIMLAFVSMTHSIPIFPAPFITAIEILSLCTSIPIYFLLSIEGVPFCRG